MEIPQPTIIKRQYRKRGDVNEVLTCSLCNVEKNKDMFKSYRHQCTECFNKLQSEKQKLRVLARQLERNRKTLEFKLEAITQLLT